MHHLPDIVSRGRVSCYGGQPKPFFGAHIMALFDLDEIIDWLYSIGDWINSVSSYMYTHFSNLYDLTYDLSRDLSSLTAEISALPETIFRAIEDKRDDILTWVNDAYIWPLTEYVGQQITNIYLRFADVTSEIWSIQDDIDYVYDVITSLPDIIDQRIQAARTLIEGWIIDSAISIIETVLEREKGP